jgi:hypothetical protein
VPPILPPTDGFLFLDSDKLAESFAADLPSDDAALMPDRPSMPGRLSRDPYAVSSSRVRAV